MIKRFRGRSPLNVSLLLLAFASSVFGQNQKPETKPTEEPVEDVVRVSTALVTLPVSVMDRQGRFITDLKQDQFHLFEDGIEQQIAYFDNAEKPFIVALLLDVSDSTKTKLADIQDAATAFIDQLRPDDKVFIVSFDKRVSILCEPTNDRKALYSAIKRTATGGGTSLYSAIDLVVRQRLSRLAGRKAVVLLTDGVDTTSELETYESTVREVNQLDALIYSIQYQTAEDVSKTQSDSIMSGQWGNGRVVTSKGEPLRIAYERGQRFLQLLPDSTGGRFFHADSLNKMKERFASIAAELREQYSLAYYPTNRSSRQKKRDLKVRVTLPNIAVKSRRSYIYAPVEQ